jgi:transcriptional regulator with XRE-family HTH domain
MSMGCYDFSYNLLPMGFRENLKAQLQYSDMLVKELAASSGVKKQTIDSYLREHGYTPSVEAAVKIAHALGVSVEYLVTGHDESNREKPLAAMKPEIRLLVQIADELDEDDQKIVLNLAKSLKCREDKTRL